MFFRKRPSPLPSFADPQDRLREPQSGLSPGGRGRKRNAAERVDDLKARVESLRQLDETGNSKRQTLNDFLAGRDVATTPVDGGTGNQEQGTRAYEAQTSGPTEGPSPMQPEGLSLTEVDLELELQRYLARLEQESSQDGRPE